MPRLPEIRNVMKRDATIARDQKRYGKDATHCQRLEHYVKRCHSLPGGSENVRGLENMLEKREAMLQKRKDVESHAWGDLKCDRVVLSFLSFNKNSESFSDTIPVISILLLL